MTGDPFWDFFESHIKEHNPADLGLLPPGASQEAIREAERTMQVELPGAVKSFYERHNGSGTLKISPWKFGGGSQQFLPLEEVIDAWKFMCETGEKFEREYKDFGTQHGPIKKSYWNRKWIPIATNQGGDYVFLDFDPEKGGSPGQVVDWWHEPAESNWVAAGFAEWLREVENALQNGEMRFGTAME